MSNADLPAARLHRDHPLHCGTRLELVSKLADLAAHIARFDVLIEHGDASLAESFRAGRLGAQHLHSEAARLLAQTDAENPRGA